jgi:hypothetical protein
MHPHSHVRGAVVFPWPGQGWSCLNPYQGHNITLPFQKSLPSSFRSVLFLVFHQLFVVVLAVDPFVQVLRGSGLFRVAFIEFFELLQALYKIPG